MRLLNLFKRKPRNQIVNDEIAEAEVIPMPQQGNGGVRKVKHKQFNIDEPRLGGRVIKTMPRSLRRMKELAEKTDE